MSFVIFTQNKNEISTLLKKDAPSFFKTQITYI